MVPVYQEVLNDGNGDCLRAAIASLLEVPLSAVPNFMDLPHNSDEEFWINFYAFLGVFGYSDYPYFVGDKKWIFDNLDGYSINGGTLVLVQDWGMDVLHAVCVDKEGTIIHDPNPNSKGTGMNIAATCFHTVQLPLITHDFGKHKKYCPKKEKSNGT